jgi:hypothetical protein
MNIIFTTLRRLIAALAVRDTAADALSAMSPRELADLPAYHPRFDA